jgi:predicted metal-dependent phosphoesterase TrpH
MATVDLHMHSTASDGRLAPADLVALAAERGLAVIALTDHDTLRGIPEAHAAGQALGVRVLPGIEISGRYPRGQCHLLAWLPDPVPAEFAAWTAGKERDREERARQMVERLREHGASITWDDVRSRAAGNIGRPHVADALIATGDAADRRDAFDRWIGRDGPGYVPSGKIEPVEAVALAAGAGALVSLAHPYTLELDDAALDAFVGALADAGLGAIEAHRGDQDPERQAAYRALAQRHGLLVSPGSDFHGDEREARGLGFTGEPGIAPDDLAALLSRLPGGRGGPAG